MGPRLDCYIVYQTDCLSIFDFEFVIAIKRACFCLHNKKIVFNL